MNIQQLEYIVSLDKYRHFVRAAEACKVSQPTLSSLVHKLEEELDVTIFDRNAKPIAPTKIGRQIIDQAKVALYNLSQLKELALSEKHSDSGSLHIGVIPTVAPYVLPRLFTYMREKKRDLELRVSEMRTSVIVDKLQKAEIDMAILATPLENESLLEIPLYYEKFVTYVSPEVPFYNNDYVDTKTMPVDNLWVLQEGHCMRNQVFNFCHMQTSFSTIYEAGSIDTLVKIVDANGGYTIIPELHVPLLTDKQKKNVRPFISPEPLREISLVIRNDYVRERLVNEIVKAVKFVIPEEMIDARLKKFAVKL
jgi:LysR family hydrogen peroxide-inducible transcriptional activator